MQILFVCLGNICRSPAAEGVMRVMSHAEGHSWQIDSAGTGGYHVGELPDPRMRKAAKARGYELNSRAMQFQRGHFDEYDYIVTMDDSNYKHVVRLARDDEDKAKVHRFVDYLTRHNVHEVPDPYYGGEDGFDLVIDILEDGCEQLLQRITDE